MISSSNSNAESISTKPYKRRPLSQKTGSGLFLFSPDAKIVEKSVKICYKRINCEADKTKSKETEVVGIAAFAIAIVVILEIAGVPMPL